MKKQIIITYKSIILIVIFLIAKIFKMIIIQNSNSLSKKPYKKINKNQCILEVLVHSIKFDKPKNFNLE